MKINKKELYETLERDYINGNANLEVIGIKLGVTRACIAWYGRMMFPNWGEVTKAKKSFHMKRYWQQMQDLDIMMSRYSCCDMKVL